MPGPVRYDKKGRVKKSKPKVITGSGSRPLTKAEQNSPQVATYSPSKAPSKPPRARRNPLAGPSVQSAVERLRKRYTPPTRTRSESDLKDNMELSTKRNQTERKLEDAALRQLPTRPEAMAAESRIRANTSLNAEGTQVEKFRGKGIVGTPSVDSVTKAARSSQLRGKKKLTTPEVRQTRRQVKKARRQLRGARAALGGVPSGVPAQYRPAIRKWGKYLEREMKKNGLVGVSGGLPQGMSGAEYLSKIIQAESGWDSRIGSPENTSSAGAQGLGQFIPSTRDAFLQQFGVDAYAGPNQQIKAAAFHLDGNHTAGGLESYNPGFPADSDGTWGYYLNQDVGKSVNASPRARQRLRQAKARAARVDERAKALGIQGVRGESPNKVPKAGEPRFVNFSQDGAGTSNTKWLVPTGGNETLKFQKPLGDALIALAKASGEPIQVNSAYRSNEEQAALYQAYLNGTGNLAAPPGQSNHNHGAAVDVNLTARQRELAPQFGLGFPVGGEDWHMELVGDAANQIVAGAGGGGTYSGGSYSGGGGSVSGGVVSGPTSRIRRQATILDTLRRPEVASQLRSMGFQVTANGIFRANGESLSKTEFDKMKERFGIK